MKTTIRKNMTDLPYSLHDMRVTDFEITEDSVIFKFRDGYVKVSEECPQVAGSLEFSKVDLDFCSAYILDFWGNNGPFTGRKMPLADFIGQFAPAEFEIVDETYGYNQSKFWGYISKGEELKECIIELYHFGDMKYIAEE